MLKSMTAYGRGEAQINGTLMIVELKSFNSRFRDFSIKLSRDYTSLEGKIKEFIGRKISRGRVDFYLQKEKNGGLEGSFKLNLDLLRRYVRLTEEVKEEFHLEDKVSLSMLMGLKDVFYHQQESDLNEEWGVILSALEKAMDSLEKMRSIEGEAILKAFLGNVGNLLSMVTTIEERVPGNVERYREKLNRRISEVVESAKIDESRLAQEVAYIAERSDITEELVRLKSHIDQFKDLLKIDGPVGRKLEFLLQEMNREANTIGAKSTDACSSQMVVEIKSELEKIREQVQNIE